MKNKLIEKFIIGLLGVSSCVLAGGFAKSNSVFAMDAKLFSDEKIYEEYVKDGKYVNEDNLNNIFRKLGKLEEKIESVISKGVSSSKLSYEERFIWELKKNECYSEIKNCANDVKNILDAVTNELKANLNFFDKNACCEWLVFWQNLLGNFESKFNSIKELFSEFELIERANDNLDGNYTITSDCLKEILNLLGRRYGFVVKELFAQSWKQK